MNNKSMEGGCSFADFRVANHDEIKRQYDEALKSGVLDPEKVKNRKEGIANEKEIRKVGLLGIFHNATEFAHAFTSVENRKNI